MKKIFLIVVTLSSFFLACVNNSTKRGNRHSESELTRNTSVTAANAVNDLFTDSAALENFISQQNLDDSEATRIRAFYYDRNFEFAWF
jgi:hypothetical protein